MGRDFMHLMRRLFLPAARAFQEARWRPCSDRQEMEFIWAERIEDALSAAIPELKLHADTRQLQRRPSGTPTAA